MKFTKMQGIGNDYVYVNCFEETVEHPEEVARRVSDRHFGIGSDGLILICPSAVADCRMRMFNEDGSEGAMCGNGIRCVGKYVWDRGLTRKECLTIDTAAGPRRLELHVLGGAVESVTVDMGPVETGRPVRLEAAGENFSVVPADAGNPHGVIFCPDPEGINLARLGPLLEVHPALGEGRNIEFAACPDRGHIVLRVWERGSGITLACGTGACAVFAAALKENRCGPGVEARLPGGVLTLERRGENIFMTGPARTVFEGEIL